MCDFSLDASKFSVHLRNGGNETHEKLGKTDAEREII